MSTSLIPSSSTSPLQLSAQPPEESRITSTKQYLSHLSRTAFDLMNLRDLTSPWWQENFLPDFKACKDWGCVAVNLDEFLDQLRAQFTEFPDAQVECFSIVPDVSAVGGSAAKVWITMRITGSGTELWRESVTVFDWRRLGGNRWMVARMWTVRPTSPIPI